MNNKKIWDYRVVRSKKYCPSDDNSIPEKYDLLSVQEVYYDDDDVPSAHTIDLQVEGSNINELRKQLQSMMWSLDKEIVDEINSEVENVQLGRDGHGNNIYGSSDGKSIVREEV